MRRQIKLYEAIGKSAFRVVNKGKEAEQLMGHVVNKTCDGVDISDEPVLRPLDNKTTKALESVTSQAVREAEYA